MTVRHSLLIACLALVAACDKSDTKSAAEERDRTTTTTEEVASDDAQRDETATTAPVTPPAAPMPPMTPSTPAAPEIAGTTPPASPMPAKLDDAQVAKMLSMVNTAEIDAGRLAKSKSKNADVQAFAQMMIDEHSANEQKLQTLAGTLGTAADAPALATAKQEHDATAAKLKALEGAAFDQAYVDAMVQGHQDVLTTIDTELLPNATSLELKSFLTETRAKVATHVEHAKTLQTKLGTAPTTN